MGGGQREERVLAHSRAVRLRMFPGSFAVPQACCQFSLTCSVSIPDVPFHSPAEGQEGSGPSPQRVLSLGPGMREEQAELPGNHTGLWLR